LKEVLALRIKRRSSFTNFVAFTCHTHLVNKARAINPWLLLKITQFSKRWERRNELTRLIKLI